MPHVAEKTIPLIVVAGATGTGKSAIALHLAHRLNGVVINADSRQVYGDFPLITAQPSPEEMADVPHALYGFLPTRKKLSAGAYAELAAETIARVHASSRVPILVGGTGLYLRTLLQGIAPIPPVPEHVHAAWQERLAAEGPQALHRLLEERDPATAARLHPNDSQRITRALEVLEGTGRTLGHWHALPVTEPPYAVCGVYLDMPLALLAPRLEARIDAMLEAGAENEARAALASCPDPNAPGWSGIGCAELYRFLADEMDYAACRALWLANTRAYAKRQITWFKKDRSLTAFAPGDTSGITSLCTAFLEQ